MAPRAFSKKKKKGEIHSAGPHPKNCNLYATRKAANTKHKR
jgi:hypothetical protein